MFIILCTAVLINIIVYIIIRNKCRCDMCVCITVCMYNYSTCIYTCNYNSDEWSIIIVRIYNIYIIYST